MCSHEHIISLDADEVLSETLIQSILQVKENWKMEGYEMNRRNNYCGKFINHSGWYPDRKLRLWDSRKGKWGGTNPHDKYEMMNKNTSIGFLKGDLLHYTYYSVDEHYKQVEYFTTIAAKAYAEKGKGAAWYKLIVNPVAKFIDHYLLKLGFLDGQAGYLISRISAYATYLKYKKIRAIYAGKK